jgi:hypothetical protein
VASDRNCQETTQVAPAEELQTATAPIGVTPEVVLAVADPWQSLGLGREVAAYSQSALEKMMEVAVASSRGDGRYEKFSSRGERIVVHEDGWKLLDYENMCVQG